MAIQLKQGQTIEFDASAFDLSQVVIGLGWAVGKAPWWTLRHWMGKKQPDFDLDVVCFVLDKKGKVAVPGNENLLGGDVVFFNNMRHHSGHIWLSGDSRSGSGDGEDEQLVARLSSMDASIDKLVFIVSIFDGIRKGLHFGQLKDAFIRAVDGQGREMVRFNLSGGAYKNKRTMLFAEVYREGLQWKFHAIGQGYESDAFVDLLRKYV